MGEVPGDPNRLLLLRHPDAGPASTAQMRDAVGGGWSIAVALDAGEALRRLEAERIDVFVCEVAASADRALVLFGDVAQRSPRTVRLVLANRDVPRGIVGERPLVHGVVCRARAPEEMRSALARAEALRRALEDPFVRAVVDTIGTLPPLPESHRDLLSALAAERISPQKAEAILRSELIPGHERFGEQGRWSGRGDPRFFLTAAITYSPFASMAATAASLPSLWDHSRKVAVAAPAIMAVHSPDPVLRDHCHLAGLLHDVGQLVMTIHTAEYAHLMSGAGKGVSLYSLESSSLGTNHAEVGSYLLGSIPLPEPVLDAVAFHHEPQRSARRPFSPAFALHIADAFVHALDTANQTPLAERLQINYLEDLDVVNRLNEWQQTVREALEASAVEPTR